MSERPRRIGAIRIDRVIESEGPEFEPTYLIPEATPENLAPHLGWLQPHAIDPASGKLVLATQSYLVRTRHHTILIDTCVGNDKERSFAPHWHRRKSRKYLTALARLGVAPANVDYVMCTHLHPDHVGWNTRLVQGRWVPTFPNARYVFAREEWEFWEAKNRKGPKYSDGAIDDSVLPVVEAGQAEIVASDFALDEEVWLEPTPGHTPGHVSVRLASAGHHAVMCGDVVHSPVQCAHPEWNAVGCFDKARSAATRRAFLDQYAERDVLVMTAHFPSPSVGHVISDGAAFRFRFSAPSG